MYYMQSVNLLAFESAAFRSQLSQFFFLLFLFFFRVAFLFVLGSFWGAFWGRFGSQKLIKMRTCDFLKFIGFPWGFQYFLVFWRVLISSYFSSFFDPFFAPIFIQFLVRLGVILGGFWEPKSVILGIDFGI